MFIKSIVSTFVVCSLCLISLLKSEVYTSCMNPGQIALTYADGPSPYTGNLLKILKDNDVKASFFFSGDYLDIPYVQSYIKQIALDGHMMGIVIRQDISNIDIDDESNENNPIKNLTTLRNKIKKLNNNKDVNYIQLPYSPNYPDDLVSKLESMDFVVTSLNLDSEDYKYYKSTDMSFVDNKKTKTKRKIDSNFEPVSIDINSNKDKIINKQDNEEDDNKSDTQSTNNKDSNKSKADSKDEQENDETSNKNTDVSSKDHTVMEIYSSVENQINKIVPPAKGAFIMVQHDTISKSVEATKHIVKFLRKKKYDLVRIDECIGKHSLQSNDNDNEELKSESKNTKNMHSASASINNWLCCVLCLFALMPILVIAS